MRQKLEPPLWGGIVGGTGGVGITGGVGKPVDGGLILGGPLLLKRRAMMIRIAVIISKITAAAPIVFALSFLSSGASGVEVGVAVNSGAGVGGVSVRITISGVGLIFGLAAGLTVDFGVGAQTQFD